MQYNTIVEKDESGLQMILDAAEKFEESKYLHAITERNFTKNEVFEILLFVKEYKIKLEKEHYALAKFAITFNKRYATDNNKCFSTAERIFNRIRSTISGSKKIYKKFCKRNMKPIPPIVKEENYASIFKRSTLLSECRNGDLFGYKHYDEVVYELYKELEGCFKELITCLALCHAVIWEEEQIRNSPERCLAIYHNCVDQVVDNAKYMIRLFRKTKSTTEIDEIGKKMKSAKSLKKCICDGFHNYNNESFQIHVATEYMNREQNMTAEENILWPQENDKVEKIRCIIAHFDELNPEGHSGKLSGAAVAAFMLWCGIGRADCKCKMFVEDYFNKEYKGKFKTVNVNTINTAKGKITQENSNFEIEKFNKEIENLLNKYMLKKERIYNAI